MSTNNRPIALAALTVLELSPPERPTDVPTLLHQARAERLMPGDGASVRAACSSRPARFWS